MRMGTALAFLAVISMATVAGAQTKIMGKNHCGPPEGQQTLEVGDKEGHIFSMAKYQCSWTEGFEINGIKAVKGVSTGFDDISGGKSKTRGYYVDSMANGDQARYSWSGKAKLKGEAIETVEIKWELHGGTGKMEGVKGSGTCTGKGAADGGVDWECTGEYTST